MLYFLLNVSSNPGPAFPPSCLEILQLLLAILLDSAQVQLVEGGLLLLLPRQLQPEHNTEVDPDPPFILSSLRIKDLSYYGS